MAVTDGVPADLTRANATMTRLTLMCDIGAPFLVGLLLSTSAISQSAAYTVCIVCAWFGLALLPKVLLLNRATSRMPSRVSRPMPIDALSDPLPLNAAAQAARTVREWAHDWTIYARQPVFLASLAFAVAWLTVLSPGGTMSAWLVSQNTSALTIAGFRAASAVCGFASTFGAQALIGRVGPARAGIVGVATQATSLVVAMILMFAKGPVEAFLLFVVLSRVGLWAYDIAEVCVSLTLIFFILTHQPHFSVTGSNHATGRASRASLGCVQHRTRAAESP
jgi:iron-regulated transporter 1